MFYVAATIYNSTSWRPMRCHKCSPHRKTAPWAETFVPTSQECQERPHPESTRGASAADLHPLLHTDGGVLGIPEGTQEAGFAHETVKGTWPVAIIGRETAHIVPKIGCRLKTSTKQIHPYPTEKACHIHLHVHEHLPAEYQCLLFILMDSH